MSICLSPQQTKYALKTLIVEVVEGRREATSYTTRATNNILSNSSK